MAEAASVCKVNRVALSNRSNNRTLSDFIAIVVPRNRCAAIGAFDHSGITHAAYAHTSGGVIN